MKQLFETPGAAQEAEVFAFASEVDTDQRMRRILRKIAENELSSLGDTSTLADPSVVDDLVKNRAQA